MLGILLLVATVSTWGLPVTGYTVGCVPRRLCVDKDALQELAQSVAHNISSSHDRRILLKMKQFRKITRWPKLHGCVMIRVADFYDHVLRRKLGMTENDHVGDRRGPFVDLMGLMQHLDDCVRVDEMKCQGLNAKAEKMPLIETPPVKKMQPREWAILQIQQLNQAMKNISDAETLSKAIDELKVLHNYIKGSGVRNWSKE
ncbi:uncharacterized protein si:ch211-266a5.12 [Clupea harengus]|uniref:Uncharacterized protein si:ch211-266a5.12 n=1 Tax=Clupea harengus TaxID=7950 RepID=A0A6P8EEX8_CLUHA|nr:uncharacterized protein si:ch211-266a5.12 [Clupea harengus]